MWSLLLKSVYHCPVITPTCSHYHSSVSLKEIVAVDSRFMFCWSGIIVMMMMLHSKCCFIYLFLIRKLHQKFNPDRRPVLQSKALRQYAQAWYLLGKALIFHGHLFCKAQDELWTQVVSSNAWEWGTACWSPGSFTKVVSLQWMSQGHGLRSEGCVIKLVDSGLPNYCFWVSLLLGIAVLNWQI